MSLRDADSIHAREEVENNALSNPQGTEFDELVKSTLEEIDHLRSRGLNEREARKMSIEGHAEGWELSSNAEMRLSVAIFDARGVAP